MGMGLSCEKDIAIIVAYPRIVKILGALKDNGISEEVFPKWLGVMLAKMLLIDFREYETHRDVADKLDNVLRDFHSDVYDISLNVFISVRHITITRIGMLSDNSIVFYLDKDKYD